MKRSFLLFFFIVFSNYLSGNSYGKEYEWKRVEKRSWRTKFFKTTVKLPSDEEQDLREKLHENFECPISSEEFDDLPFNSTVVKTPCNHFFCRQSLIDWLDRTRANSQNKIAMKKEPIHFTCPICQQVISGEENDLTFYKKKKVKKYQKNHEKTANYAPFELHEDE